MKYYLKFLLLVYYDLITYSLKWLIRNLINFLSFCACTILNERNIDYLREKSNLLYELKKYDE